MSASDFDTVRSIILVQMGPTPGDEALDALARIEARLTEQTKTSARKRVEVQRMRDDRQALAERVREACAEEATNWGNPTTARQIGALDLAPLLEPR